jgi:gliding motility-associated-like protein
MKKNYLLFKLDRALKCCLLVFSLLLSNHLSAQCCSYFNDQLNTVSAVDTYYPAPANTTINSGSLTIPLDAVPQIDQFGNSYGTVPISAGDVVLIIQMQGASFNAGDNNLYGANSGTSGPDGIGGTGYTNLNNVGQYEFVVALNDVPLSGGSLQINGACSNGGLLNNYSNTPATSVSGQQTFQVVRVPRFNNLTLTQNITATAWNGTVGGVLAFFVLQNFDLNGFTVSAAGKGFRGGYQNVRPSGNTVSVYATTDINLSSGKGEGVCGTPRFLWNGQDQVDNGIAWIGYPGGNYGRGGPGNAGGGGNTHNAGGGGGAGYGAGGVGGNGIAGTGTAGWPNGGRPGTGILLPSDRLIMGGGGGGGDANNAQSGVKGGAGGGIIFIKAGTVSGNGTIDVSGTNGQVGVYGSAPDGAGGGGAGGNIFFITDVNANGASVTLNSNAGNGGNTLNDATDQHGPGGGGGGGTIFYSLPGAALTTSVSAGNSGLSNNGNGTPHGALNGQPGIVSTIDPLVLSPNLTITINPFPVANFLVSEICKDEPYQFTDLSTVSTTNNTVIQNWTWNFGDGSTSTSQNPTHTYSTSGTFSVSLIIETNHGCKDTLVQNLEVFNPYQDAVNVSECDSYTWSENGQIYTNSGNYTASYQTIHGCDSTKVLNLTIFPSYSVTVQASICQGENYVFNGNTYNSAGFYAITLNTVNGCDSIASLDLVVNPIPPSPILSASTVKCPGDPVVLSAEQVSGLTLDWAGPNNFSSQAYDNEFSLTQGLVGDYFATYSALGCVSPASAINLWIDYDQVLEAYNFPNVITANGDGINDEIAVSVLAQTCEPFELLILNRWGQVMYSGNESSTPFNGKNVDGQALTEGIYFYKLFYEGGEKTGFLHIVR